MLKSGYGHRNQAATDAGRDAANSSGVCEQRHATDRVLPQSRHITKHSRSPSEKAAQPEASKQRGQSVVGGAADNSARELAAKQWRVSRDVTQWAQDRSEPRIRCWNAGALAQRFGAGVSRVGIRSSHADLFSGGSHRHAQSLRGAVWAGARPLVM